jgi:hypothetical protein
MKEQPQQHWWRVLFLLEIVTIHTICSVLGHPALVFLFLSAV